MVRSPSDLRLLFLAHFAYPVPLEFSIVDIEEENEVHNKHKTPRDQKTEHQHMECRIKRIYYLHPDYSEAEHRDYRVDRGEHRISKGLNSSRQHSVY